MADPKVDAIETCLNATQAVTDGKGSFVQQECIDAARAQLAALNADNDRLRELLTEALFATSAAELDRLRKIEAAAREWHDAIVELHKYGKLMTDDQTLLSACSKAFDARDAAEVKLHAALAEKEGK